MSPCVCRLRRVVVRAVVLYSGMNPQVSRQPTIMVLSFSLQVRHVMARVVIYSLWIIENTLELRMPIKFMRQS